MEDVEKWLCDEADKYQRMNGVCLYRKENEKLIQGECSQPTELVIVKL